MPDRTTTLGHGRSALPSHSVPLSSPPSLHNASLKLVRSVTKRPPSPHRRNESQEVEIRPERKTLKKRKNKTVALRREITGSSLRLREKRRELGDEQANAIDLETKLMQSMHLFYELGVVPDKVNVDRVYASLKEARDQLGSLQYEYDCEEDEHYALEFQLDEEDVQYSDNDTESGHLSLVSGTPESEAAVIEPLNPIVYEYYSRVGDANNIHESLTDLQVEQRQLLDDTAFRKNHHIKPYAENVEFLAGVHKRYDELYAELKTAEADIAKLGQRATEMGFEIDSRLPIRISQSLLPSKQLFFKETTPVLHRNTQTDDVLPYLVSDYIEVRAHISRWILNNLKNSPVERVKYRKNLLEDLERDSINDKTWANAVFEYWGNDQDGESFDGSGDDISQQDDLRSQNLHLLNDGDERKLYFPLGSRKAWKAVRDHMIFFGEQVKEFSAYREESIRATLDRGYPYPANSIEQDLLPEYESRSI